MTSTPLRPQPRFPEPDTEPFWEATKRHELTYQTCDDCNNVIFFPRRHCTACGSGNTTWHVSKGEGEVYTFSVVMQRPAPRVQGPRRLRGGLRRPGRGLPHHVQRRRRRRPRERGAVRYAREAALGRPRERAAFPSPCSSRPDRALLLAANQNEKSKRGSLSRAGSRAGRNSGQARVSFGLGALQHGNILFGGYRPRTSDGGLAGGRVQRSRHVDWRRLRQRAGLLPGLRLRGRRVRQAAGSRAPAAHRLHHQDDGGPVRPGARGGRASWAWTSGSWTGCPRSGSTDPAKRCWCVT